MGSRRGQPAPYPVECRHESRNRSPGGLVSSATPCSVRDRKMSNQSPWQRTLAGRPELGSHAERSRTTTMRDVEMFTEMTGDKNPIHYDAALAAKSPFGGLIVQGGVTTGLLNAVVAE